MANKRLIKNGIGALITIVIIGIIYYVRDSRMESYYSPKPLATHYSGKAYVGSETCLECHADIYQDHLKTAHFNTSSPGDSDNMKGNFDDGENDLKLQDVRYEMVSKNNSFYEHAFYKDESKKNSISKIDIIIGSGVKGQSYLSWQDDKLFQLQPSFFVPSNSWINSPNYPQQYSLRAISDACLKCHTTFAKNLDPRGIGNQYEKEKLLYGVDCERCHQPSADHVSYHRKNPDVKIAKFVPEFSELSRQQRLDACAVCHSGLRSVQLKGNPFSFLTGDDLDQFSKNPNSSVNTAELDVHGNQYGLLTSSECFIQTEKMDCMTCHDPHKNQRGNIALFNQKCIECHSVSTTSCEAENTNLNKMGNNCVACHMPNIPSKVMKLQLAKDSLETPVNIRTHLIAIYPEEYWNK